MSELDKIISQNARNLSPIQVENAKLNIQSAQPGRLAVGCMDGEPPPCIGTPLRMISYK